MKYDLIVTPLSIQALGDSKVWNKIISEFSKKQDPFSRRLTEKLIQRTGPAVFFLARFLLVCYFVKMPLC